MLAWDYQMAPHRRELSAMGQPQRLAVALGSIDDVHVAAVRILMTGPKEAREFYRSARELIRSSVEVAGISVEAARPLLTAAQGWLPDAGAGIRDVGVCLALVLDKAGRTLTESDVFNTMSYSYQVVLYEEVLSKLESETTEVEVQRMEASSPACVACIADQIRLITSASLNAG